MSGPRCDRIAMASMAFALLLAVAPGALGQDGGKPDATFNERYPAEQPKTAPITAPKTFARDRGGDGIQGGRTRARARRGEARAHGRHETSAVTGRRRAA